MYGLRFSLPHQPSRIEPNEICDQNLRKSLPLSETKGSFGNGLIEESDPLMPQTMINRVYNLPKVIFQRLGGY